MIFCVPKFTDTGQLESSNYAVRSQKDTLIVISLKLQKLEFFIRPTDPILSNVDPRECRVVFIPLL